MLFSAFRSCARTTRVVDAKSSTTSSVGGVRCAAHLVAEALETGRDLFVGRVELALAHQEACDDGDGPFAVAYLKEAGEGSCVVDDFRPCRKNDGGVGVGGAERVPYGVIPVVVLGVPCA